MSNSIYVAVSADTIEYAPVCYFTTASQVSRWLKANALSLSEETAKVWSVKAVKEAFERFQSTGVFSVCKDNGWREISCEYLLYEVFPSDECEEEIEETE